MLIKYRVHEVAKDFNVPSKDVVELLKKHFGDTKKHMTALTEDELDVVFDYYTQKNSLESFDSYFAVRDKMIEEKNNEILQQESKSETKAEVKSAEQGTDNKKQSQKNNKQAKTTAENQQSKAQAQNQNQSQNTQPQKREKRVIDTRAAVVDIERYNEKYDRLASEKIRNENTVSKQKITQRSQRRGKQKSGKRETEQERLKRIAAERKAKPITVTIPDEITVNELALRLKATAAEVIKKLFLMGTMVTVNDVIDYDTAALVAMEFHAKVEKEVVVTIEERIIDDSEDDDDNLIPRAPVVVVMGHVDHGKTSLLDAIRHANVTQGEAGGITQHIGAYRVKINDRDITFLDTPGHEAFTTMRARGAQVTDIAILVVAADDGIMPQTVEAINHAKAAGVSIVVAINKMDKVGANPENVKQQLTEYELVPEEWGGDVPCIPVSAKTKEGISDLLEMVTLIADMKELKANPDRSAKGTVIEARLDKGRGPIATVLVQNGTLRVGDIIVAGTSVGRVRAMTNDKGERVKEAGPSIPVEITGLDDAPTGGDIFNAVSDERLARELVEQRKNAQKEELFSRQTKVTLDNLFDQMKYGEVKELKIIVKADVQGSVEAVRQSLEKLSNEEVRVNVIHGGVGAINESDVMLASASDAIIVGFNVRPDPVAAENAERGGVDMRLYRVIYDCIEEIESAMKGMLAPKTREIELGKAECRNVIKVKNVGFIAGSYVLSGKVTRNAGIRVVRDGIVVAEDSVASLQRFKDSVKEVAAGYECGIGLERFNDLKEGDIFEVFEIEEYRD
ncbi:MULTISPECIES: translation initiation factor IF-2 [unclassified Ruminococcus]|uniref:translation initiation factor IF-2 n=1 Tax=unclassified Ruminococcus TaxID=2608920 RepID=UPI00210F0850|nr:MULTISPECIES: translation initiation factor IF-2 [unclassified Ruminococcus]MCQ4021980.1 translation initiation factor IF-2 [Ruminococcus sp. zg-924]MCQ4114516.1 translation initiation factor IF-2 [Ruminococcus sp. zg-921]